MDLYEKQLAQGERKKKKQTQNNNKKAHHTPNKLRLQSVFQILSSATLVSLPEASCYIIKQRYKSHRTRTEAFSAAPLVVNEIQKTQFPHKRTIRRIMKQDEYKIWKKIIWLLKKIQYIVI